MIFQFWKGPKIQKKFFGGRPLTVWPRPLIVGCRRKRAQGAPRAPRARPLGPRPHSAGNRRPAATRAARASSDGREIRETPACAKTPPFDARFGARATFAPNRRSRGLSMWNSIRTTSNCLCYLKIIELFKIFYSNPVKLYIKKQRGNTYCLRQKRIESWCSRAVERRCSGRVASRRRRMTSVMWRCSRRSPECGRPRSLSAPFCGGAAIFDEN